MAVDVMSAVLNHSEACGTDRLVLLALADAADPKNAVTWLPIEPPRHETSDGSKCITHRARCSKREVIRAIKALEQAGELQKRRAQRGQKRISVYKVCVGPYAGVDVDYDDLPFDLDEPFSTGCQIVTSSTNTGSQEERVRGDEMSPHEVTDQPPHGVTAYAGAEKTEPSVEPSVDLTRDSDESLVPDTSGERARRRLEIELALTAELGVRSVTMTRSERGAWEVAIRDLLDVDADGQAVTARCGAYRGRWPEMALTPLALVRHWSLLGALIETARPSGFERWVEAAPGMFSRDEALEIVADMAGIDDEERTRRRLLVNFRYDRAHDDEAEAA